MMVDDNKRKELAKVISDGDFEAIASFVNKEKEVESLTELLQLVCLEVKLQSKAKRFYLEHLKYMVSGSIETMKRKAEEYDD